MATLENEMPQGEIEVCQWCRMGLHARCDMKIKITGVCMCICERGF